MSQKPDILKLDILGDEIGHGFGLVCFKTKSTSLHYCTALRISKRGWFLFKLFLQNRRPAQSFAKVIFLGDKAALRKSSFRFISKSHQIPVLGVPKRILLRISSVTWPKRMQTSSEVMVFYSHFSHFRRLGMRWVARKGNGWYFLKDTLNKALRLVSRLSDTLHFEGKGFLQKLHHCNQLY